MEEKKEVGIVYKGNRKKPVRRGRNENETVERRKKKGKQRQFSRLNMARHNNKRIVIRWRQYTTKKEINKIV